VMTASNGRPIETLTSSETVGPRGLITLQVYTAFVMASFICSTSSSFDSALRVQIVRNTAAKQCSVALSLRL
jgi:hypothetical protein